MCLEMLAVALHATLAVRRQAFTCRRATAPRQADGGKKADTGALDCRERDILHRAMTAEDQMRLLFKAKTLIGEHEKEMRKK